MHKMFPVKRFVIQLILVFLLFTVGTVVILGIPAILLFRHQINNQMTHLIEQTNQTTLALFDNQSAQAQSLARLLAERPTLNRLVNEVGDLQALADYLGDFLDNSEIDTVALCNQDGLTASAGAASIDVVCSVENPVNFIELDGNAWLIAQEALLDDPGTSVVVGKSASNLLEEISRQTGMEFVLFFEDEVLVDRSPMKFDASSSQLLPNASRGERVTMRLNSGQMLTYRTTLVPLTLPDEFELVGLLNIDDMLAVNRQFRLVILAVLLGVSLIGTLVAVLVSKRVSQPLSRLAQSATALREGDLTTPLTMTSQIWEIDQLTNALEDARVSLKYSLDQLRQEKSRIENLMNSIVEGLLVVDENYRITFASDALAKMLGVDAAQILGHSVDDYFLPTSGEDSFSQQLPDLNQTRRIPVFLNNREVLLSLSASSFLPYDAGNASRALVLRDVTDEERIHRLLGEFLANITHEFRTPLSALSASVELLLDDLPELSTQEIGQLLHSLNIGIIDLQSLIDNLVEAASIEAGRFRVNPQEVELRSIIQSAIETVQPIVKKHGLSIVQPKKQFFPVMADRRRTSQALVNLLSNAIKHSPEGGKITIRTLIMKQDVLVEVQDEGKGVFPEQQSHLFKRFVSSGSNEGLSSVGLGIGLSVVKAIIEAQNGKVGYKKGDNGGANFWFTLPLVKRSDL